MNTLLSGPAAGVQGAAFVAGTAAMAQTRTTLSDYIAKLESEGYTEIEVRQTDAGFRISAEAPRGGRDIRATARFAEPAISWTPARSYEYCSSTPHTEAASGRPQRSARLEALPSFHR